MARLIGYTLAGQGFIGIRIDDVHSRCGNIASRILAKISKFMNLSRA